MKTYTFEPSDLLFIRDARPIDIGGHGARWPDSPLIFDAIHAALHRAFPTPQPWEHTHCEGVSKRRDFAPENRTQRFGGLATAGIFPVDNGKWLFPRPADWREDGTQGAPLKPELLQGCSNLPSPLTHSLANPCKPSKAEAKPWWTKAAFDSYLAGKQPAESESKTQSDLYDGEWQTGIRIDPERQTQDGEGIYSAEYLRLREGVSAGFFAALPTKQNEGPPLECIDRLFASDSAILIGGQLRSCTVKASTAPATDILPTGATITGTRLKWILLTPAIFPAIGAHPGGWLPSWIDAQGHVQLLDGPGKNKAKRSGVTEGKPIGARLVAACVPRAVALSGWSERIEAAKDAGHIDNRGPRATMLAVPAGSVYYFEADSPEEAQKLASTLNWHASPNFHRRSTLLGEKGLGLGICTPW